MADGRRKSLWGPASAVMAMLFNVNRSSKVSARGASDFNPYCEKREEKPIAIGASEMAMIFCRNK